MTLAPERFVRLEAGRVIARDEPMRVTVRIDNLPTVDHHALVARFEFGVMPAASMPDRALLREVLLAGRTSIDLATLRDRFVPSMRAALLHLSRSETCAASLGFSTRKIWSDALIAAGKTVAFSCGLEILPPFEFDLFSPTLEKQQAEEVSRARAEASHEQQIKHIRRSAELLAEFENARQTNPGISSSALLDRSAAGDRGELLRALLSGRCSDRAASTILVVSGPYLLSVDTSVTPAKFEQTKLDALGPLRSAKGSGGHLGEVLVGARDGVLVLQNSSVAGLYRGPISTSQRGYNAVARTKNMLFATHSELGLVGWNSNQHDAPIKILSLGDLRSPSAKVGPRNLLTVDDQVAFSIGSAIIFCNPDGTRDRLQLQSECEVVALLPAPNRSLVAVCDDGVIVEFEALTRKETRRHSSKQRVTAAASLPWLDDPPRYLLAREDGSIDCISLDEPSTITFHGPTQAVRAIAATADRIVALSHDRQRLLLWRPWEWQIPATEIHLTHMTQHRAAHVSLTR